MKIKSKFAGGELIYISYITCQIKKHIEIAIKISDKLYLSFATKHKQFLSNSYKLKKDVFNNLSFPKEHWSCETYFKSF